MKGQLEEWITQSIKIRKILKITHQDKIINFQIIQVLYAMDAKNLVIFFPIALRKARKSKQRLIQELRLHKHRLILIKMKEKNYFVIVVKNLDIQLLIAHKKIKNIRKTRNTKVRKWNRRNLPALLAASKVILLLTVLLVSQNNKINIVILPQNHATCVNLPTTSQTSVRKRTKK